MNGDWMFCIGFGLILAAVYAAYQKGGYDTAKQIEREQEHGKARW